MNRLLIRDIETGSVVADLDSPHRYFVVPREGERILWSHEIWVVESIIHDYEGGVVIVEVEKMDHMEGG